MTDLTKLLADIQKPETSHVDLYKRRAMGTLQWFLEKDAKTHPIHNNNDLQFYMCGQEGFAAIEADIRAATTSIDIVLWGFDPGMELVRNGATWPRGTTYGDLLTAKANQGVKVRLLVWFDGDVPLSEYLFFVPGIGPYLAATGGYLPGVNPIAKATGNVPDIGPVSGQRLSPSQKGVQAPAPSSNGLSGSFTLGDRASYCREWWTQALRGAFPNLEIRLRKMHPAAVASNAQTHLPASAKSLAEQAGMKRVATHHQKPILIDYAAADKNQCSTRNTCGYVMGLNSVTDYWDTPEHSYNNPLRELSPASGTVSERSLWYLKPYRDYAIRVTGEALHDLNANFVEGWDKADGYGAAHGAKGPSLAEARKSIQPQDLPRPPGAACRSQIVRTFPDRGEANILKAYTLATSNALNYLYVENQYFQLSEWTKLLKQMRQQYRTGMLDAGATVNDIRPLHVFVVIPQAERDQMVPATYDTLNQLGQTQNMGAYGKAVGEHRKPVQPQQQQPGLLQQTGRALVQGVAAVLNPVGTVKGVINDMQREGEEKLKRAIVKESADAAPANPVGELNDLGIKTLAAMLLTYDAGNQARDIRIKDRDNNAQRAQAQKEEEANKTGERKGKANDVDLERRDECTIQPPSYREIYIHSKLMLIDDVYTTLGSANLNARSMVGDSELNICTEQPSFTQAARKRVWGNLAGADLDGKSCTPGEKGETGDTFGKWVERMDDNKKNRKASKAPINGSFIHPFEDPRGVPLVRLA